ncbi:MAG: hypothetical protein MZV70_17160 [Desulfobacterales bacterium]|nr:hypothetical protein [Desulfobacterales bacterium]
MGRAATRPVPHAQIHAPLGRSRRPGAMAKSTVEAPASTPAVTYSVSPSGESFPVPGLRGARRGVRARQEARRQCLAGGAKRSSW